MPASLTTLPPELLRQILGHLPRPSLGPPLAAPSPLLATSLLSATLKDISQELLFHSVTVVDEVKALRWRDTAASPYTRELKVIGEWREEGDDDGAVEWLSKVFDGRGGGRLVVLEMDGVQSEDFDLGWIELSGLQNLTALSLTSRLPPTTLQAPYQLEHLTHLRLYCDIPFPMAPSAVLPSVTHLSLFDPGPNPLPLAPTFPALEHLTLSRFKAFHMLNFDTRLLAGMVAGCTHLTTLATGYERAVFALAWRLAIPCFTFAPGGWRDWTGVVDNWFKSKHNCPGRQTLTLLGKTKGEAERLARWAEFVQRAAATGCKLEVRKFVALPWR